MNEIKLKFPKAYKKWSLKEDNVLKKLLNDKKDIFEISKLFQRKPSAVSSRIIKFEDENLENIPDGLILLAPTNRRTFQINHIKLNNLASPEFTFKGKITGSFKTSDMMSELELKLKVGAQIMLTKNQKT